MTTHASTARVARALAALLLAASAGAQRFAFVSSRVPDPDAATYGRPPQTEVFVYRDGSEARLTRTPHASEHDPTPAPGGRFVAFAALEHGDEAAGWQAWSWDLVVVDALTGREVARWPLPGMAGGLRPAGGFQVTWVGEDTLLAQGVGQDGEWDVLRFAVGAPEPSFVTDGYGVVLGPDGRLATGRNTGVHVLDLRTGRESLVHAGVAQPLTWWRGDLLVEREEGAVLVDVATLTARPFGPVPTAVVAAAVDPTGERLAYARLGEAGTSTEVLVTDGAADARLLFASRGWLEGLAWLDAETLVFAVTDEAGASHVRVVSLVGGGFAVDSAGDDHSPRPFPGR